MPKSLTVTLTNLIYFEKSQLPQALANRLFRVAASAMLQHDTGVLCAPTAFGKTVTAAAMIARRRDILTVFQRLQEASQQRHLPAFRRCAERGVEGGGCANRRRHRGRWR
jgi:hypothetical protein